MLRGLPGTSVHLFDDLMQHPEDNDMSKEPKSMDSGSVALSITLDVSMVLLNVLPISMLICRPRDRRSISMEQLILALSITDVLAVLVPSPLAALVASISLHGWCHVYQMSVLCFQLASMCLLSATCVERWIAVRCFISLQSSAEDSYHHHRLQSQSQAQKMNHTFHGPQSSAVSMIHRCRPGVRCLILAVYALSLCIASLPLYGLAPPAGAICHAWLTSTHARSPQQHVFCFLYLLLAYCNVLMVLMVNVSQIFNLGQLQKMGSSCKHKTEGRDVLELSVMVLVVSLLYHVTWIPALVSIAQDKLYYY